MTPEELVDNKPKMHKLNVLPQNPEEKEDDAAVGPGRFPSWLHRKLPTGGGLAETGSIIGSKRLHTVCEEARCPNLFECWSRKTATFLILGKECTRACGFCSIDFSKTPKAPEVDEPERIALSVKELQLNHVVITQVARDDLEDGGAAHLSHVITAIRAARAEATVETLSSDFEGKTTSIDAVLVNAPEIFNHNVETVRRLTPRVRHKATYDRSLAFLNHLKERRPPGMLIKSGLMLGLGETMDEVHETMRDLVAVGCDIVTIGQYLQPDRTKLRIKEFIHPDTFRQLEEFGNSIGIPFVYAGPFIRSSYNADKVFSQLRQKSA